MKVLVTGSSGFIGTAVVEDLRQRGHQVVGYDRLQNQNVINRDKLFDAMEHVYTVVHLAGIPHPNAKLDWWDYWLNNCIGTHNVAEVAYDQGVRRLIFASSTAYYGMELPWEPTNLPVGKYSHNIIQASDPRLLGDEHSPTTLYYPISKVIAEAILATYGLRKAMEVVIFRLCPCTKEGVAYPAWDIRVRLDRVVNAISYAVEAERELWYEVYNLAQPDVATVLTGSALRPVEKGQHE
jgi:nucleoside-diphosphate-sugar epimerase